MKKVNISGMKCEKCAGRVKKALIALGCENVQVDPGKGLALLDSPSAVSEGDIRTAVESLGFTVTSVE